jgi:hypothetical protein
VVIRFIDTTVFFQTSGDSWAFFETATYLQYERVDSIPLNLILDWGILLPYIVSLAQAESLIFFPSFSILISFLTILVIFEFIYNKNKLKIDQLNIAKKLSLIVFNLLFGLALVLSQTPFLFQSLYMNRHLLIAAIYLSAFVVFYLTLTKKVPTYFIYINLLYIFLLANLRLDASVVFIFFLQLIFFTIKKMIKITFIVSFISTAVLAYTLHTISILNVTGGWYIEDTLNNLVKLSQFLALTMIFLSLIYLLKVVWHNKVISKMVPIGAYLVPILISLLFIINDDWLPCSGDVALKSAGGLVPDCNYSNSVALSRIIEIILSYSGYSLIFGVLVIFQIGKFLSTSRTLFDVLAFNVLFSFFTVIYFFSVILKYYTMLSQNFIGSFSRMLFHIFFVIVIILFNNLNDYVLDLLFNFRKRHLLSSVSQMYSK